MSDLPDEQALGISLRRCVAVQVMCIGLLLLYNFTAFHLLARDPAKLSGRLVQAKWELLLSQTEPADVVVLGDSSAAFAVDATWLSRKTGWKVLNLATVADMLVINDAWMLNEYIQKVGPPKVVVLMRYLPKWEWGQTSANLLAHTPLEVGFWSRMDPPVELPWMASAEMAAQRYLPLFLRNNSLALMLKTWDRITVIDRIDGTGSVVANREAFESYHDIGVLMDRINEGQPYRIAAPNDAGVRALQVACQKEGITLCLVMGVLWRPLATKPGVEDYVLKTKGLLTSLADRHPSTVVLMPEPFLFEGKDAIDESHVGPSASESFTDLLRQRILELAKSRH